MASQSHTALQIGCGRWLVGTWIGYCLFFNWLANLPLDQLHRGIQVTISARRMPCSLCSITAIDWLLNHCYSLVNHCYGLQARFWMQPHAIVCCMMAVGAVNTFKFGKQETASMARQLIPWALLLLMALAAIVWRWEEQSQASASSYS